MARTFRTASEWAGMVGGTQERWTLSEYIFARRLNSRFPPRGSKFRLGNGDRPIYNRAKKGGRPIATCRGGPSVDGFGILGCLNMISEQPPITAPNSRR